MPSREKGNLNLPNKESFFGTTLLKILRHSAIYFSLVISFLNTLEELAAQVDPHSTAVIVLGTRIQKEMVAAPTTVIEFESLENAPTLTLPDVLASESNVQVQDLFGGPGGAGATVDLRGYGAPAKSNTLILLNGRRLNDIDLAAVDFANIPRESIERIEVIPGNSGAVLYGDGAIGGVINILTKAPSLKAPNYTTNFAIGSDVYSEENFSITKRSGSFYLNTYGSYMHGDGYRDNNKLLQKNLVAELKHERELSTTFIRVNLDSQRLGLPGARLVTPTSSLLETNRRGAATPLDYAFQTGVSITLGVNQQIGEGVELVLDGGVRRKDQDASYSVDTTWDSTVDTVLDTWSLTPRVQISHRVFGFDSDTFTGVDFYFSDYDSYRRQEPGDAPKHRYDGEQYSYAIYGQTNINWSKKLLSVFGLRAQRVDLSIGDIFDSSAPGASGNAKNTLRDIQYHYAANIGLEWEIVNPYTFYVRAGRSFRFPTIDERIDTQDGYSFNLSTQTMMETELGIKFRTKHTEIQTGLFLAKTKNEIRFNPKLSGGFGTNSNFEPIQRYGWENSFKTKLRDNLSLVNNLTLMRAKFTQGDFDGKDVPLVSDVTASAALRWKINKNFKLNTNLNYVGERWLENDEDNTFPKTPAYLLLGMRLPGQYGKFSWSLTTNNLLDQNYFNYGVASTTTAGRYNAYPQPGRTFMARAGVDF